MPCNALERADILTVRNLLEYPIGDIHLMRGVGNQTRREIIDFVEPAAGAVPRRRCRPAPRTRPSPDEPSGPPTLERLEHRVVGIKIPRRTPSGASAPPCWGWTAAESRPPEQWPSQTDIADALDITRARVGQVLTADRARWSKDPPITAFRHELCEQVQRLGGVVTIPEIIDLTILLRPAAEHARSRPTSSGWRRRWPGRRSRRKTSMAEPRFQIRRVAGKVGRRLLAGTGGVRRGTAGRGATELAEADPLPPPLRVFQELYEVEPAAAAASAASPSATSGC